MMDMCRIVASLVSAASRPDLDTDIKLQLALTRAISTVGEAARRVSGDFQETHPEIDWSRIIGMRHKLVHDYFLIDYDVVWEAATVHVPRLLTALENLGLTEPPP